MHAHALSSRVTAVTVYNRGALVVREATLDAAELPAAVRITGLPLAIDDRSVRVRMEPLANGEATPTACDLRVVLDVPERDALLRPGDEAALKEARNHVARCQARSNWCAERVVRMEVELTDRPDGKEGEPPRTSPVEARLALLAWSAERQARLQHELDEANEALRLAHEALAEQEEQERRRTEAKQAREHELRKSVVVRLRGARGAHRGRLVLEYRVGGARWAPAYTVRITRDGDGEDRAEVTMRALVAQNSGEDWSDVAIRLSTADPMRWCERPELDSVRIGRRQSPKRTGWRPPPSDTDDLFADFDRMARRAPPKAPPAVRAPAPPPSAAPMPSSATLTGAVLMDPMPMESEDDDFDGFMTLDEAAPEPEMMVRALAMPASAPMRAQAKKKGGISFGSRRRSEAVAAAEGEAYDMPSQQSQAAPAGGGGFFGKAVEEPALSAAADMLDYGALRMAGPGSGAGRGRLERAARTTLYMELLSVQKVSVAVDIGAVLSNAERAANRMVEDSLPSGCSTGHDHAYDYAFASDVPATVASDGEYHAIGLTASSAPVAFSYVVVPRESTDVFRVAEVGNPLSGPLLPGPADVYVGRDFLLTTPVSFTPPDARVRLGLGVEQAIKVVRNTDYREESAGLLGGSTKLEHDIKVEAENHTSRSIRLEVRERVPHVAKSAEDDIDIHVDDVEPAWEAWSTEDAEESGHPTVHGAYRWFATIEPGAQTLLKATYTVKISAKNELVGGNRRES